MPALKYAAPEQFNQANNKVEDKRTDIYQLGIIIHELLFGTVPFTGKIFHQYQEMHCRGSIPATPKVINIALKKDPNDRYQNARDLEPDLEEVNDLDLEPSPKLYLNPEKFDLGDIPRGQKRAVTLRISNKGGGELKGKIEIDPPSYLPQININRNDFEIAAPKVEEEKSAHLRLKEIEIRMQIDTTNLKAGYHELQVKIISNGGNQVVPLTWRIPGSASPIQLEVLPEKLDFGNFRWKSQKERGLIIKNLGNKDLEGQLKVSHPRNIMIERLKQIEEGSYNSG